MMKNKVRKFHEDRFKDGNESIKKLEDMVSYNWRWRKQIFNKRSYVELLMKEESKT